MKINYKTVKQFVAFSLLIKGIVACSSDELSYNEGATPFTKGNTPPPSEIYTDSTKNGAIILSSEPVGNPYNVDTLKKAYAILFSNGGGRSATPEFTPTHYQLRFLPTDSLEFRQLMTSGLVFTTVPLDKKVAEEGTYYFDPVLEAQRAPYTWQYTIVPVTEELPNIRHEIMAQICAPNDGTRGRSIDGLSDIWPALEEKAYAMCGEVLPPKVQSRGAGLPGLPGETGKFIYVWDDMANQYIPAKGAKVVAFCHTGSYMGTVDKYGQYFTHGLVWTPTRIEIQWEGMPDDWRIFDGAKEDDASKQAIYICPFSQNRWTFRIKGGKQQTFAVATRALHRVYREQAESGIAGIDLPRGQYLKVICIDGKHPKLSGRYKPDMNTFNVWGNNADGSNKSTFKIFSTTAHELGHMMHYMNIIANQKNWNKTDKIIKESWASYIAWIVSESEYNELGHLLGRAELLSLESPITFPDASGLPGMPGSPKYNTYNNTTWYNKQGWPEIRKDGSINPSSSYFAYSPLFIDLVDQNNQYFYFRDSYAYMGGYPKNRYKGYPNDQVSGYTAYELKEAIGHALNLHQLKESVKNARYNSEADKVKIDTLFNRYIYYWYK